MKNIHVFPSRIPGKLGYIGESNQYHLFSNGENPHDLFDNLATYKDMYITSENPIEVDDWCLSLSKDAAYGEVYRCWNVALINEEDRKIALTTNKNLIQEGVQEIGLTFLQWFISNSKCESVGLVTQYKTSGGEWISYDKDFWEEGGNKPNYITTRFLPIILKDSSNLTLDELAEQYTLEKQNEDTSKYYIALEAFKKGFEAHQKRSYTYEEMKESFSKGHDSARLKGSYKSNESFEEDWESWSNQFKKEPNKESGVTQLEVGKEYEQEMHKLREETLEEAAEKYWSRQPYNEDPFVEGVKWQQERSYSREEVLFQLNLLYSMKSSTLDTFTDEKDMITMNWFKQFK